MKFSIAHPKLGGWRCDRIPRLRRQRRARILMYELSLRLCARCFFALTKKLLLSEVPYR